MTKTVGVVYTTRTGALRRYIIDAPDLSKHKTRDGETMTTVVFGDAEPVTEQAVRVKLESYLGKPSPIARAAVVDAIGTVVEIRLADDELDAAGVPSDHDLVACEREVGIGCTYNRTTDRFFSRVQQDWEFDGDDKLTGTKQIGGDELTRDPDLAKATRPTGDVRTR